MKRLILVAPVLVALVVAGCGGSDDNGSNTTSTNASSTGTLDVGDTAVGKVLVGPNGHSLYLFEKDKGPESTCSGECAQVWEPFTTTGKPAAGAGVDAAKLTTSKRADGDLQVVYAGHPLYFYEADTKAGDINGQNLDQFGAEWYVLAPSGQKVEKTASSPDPSSSSDSGGGSTY